MPLIGRFSLTSALIVLAFARLSATEYSPWFGPVLEIEGRATAFVEAYSSIDAEEDFGVDKDRYGNKTSSTNFFFDISGAIAPTEYLSAEIEVVLADTYHRSFGFDSILLTGRYRFLNDIVGDPVSLSAGLQLINVFKPSWHDLSVFHHGAIACEGHVAVGKEYSCMQFWTSRVWGFGAIGIGDVGSAWVKGDFVWDHNWWDLHEIRLFAHTLWGLGGNELNLSEPFRGYGSINHQSVDLGARYAFLMECGLSIKIEYSYRVYAKNCPKNASIASLGFQYDFGL